MYIWHIYWNTLSLDLCVYLEEFIAIVLFPGMSHYYRQEKIRPYPT